MFARDLDTWRATLPFGVEVSTASGIKLSEAARAKRSMQIMQTFRSADFVVSPGSGITLGRVASSYASSTGGKPHAANSSGSTNVVSSTTRPSASSDMTVRQTAW
jgi:hypothetical protein